MSSSSPLNVQLETYEGPLDLLLDLIRRQQINIYDIPIARITAQYLEYMQRAAELNFELGAEFVYMAATLIHIKSRLLLPRDPELDKIAPEADPRQELVDRLLEHERFKNAAEMLHQKRLIEEAIWSNPQMQGFLSEGEEGDLAVTLYDLIPHIYADIYLHPTGSAPVYYERLDNLKRADLWLAISESSRREGVEHAGLPADRVVNISSAADEHFTPGTVPVEYEVGLRLQYGLWRPYVMYTGGIDHRKNIEGLIAAWAALPAELRSAHQLAIEQRRQDRAGIVLRDRGGPQIVDGCLGLLRVAGDRCRNEAIAHRRVCRIDILHVPAPFRHSFGVARSLQ